MEVTLIYLSLPILWVAHGWTCSGSTCTKPGQRMMVLGASIACARMRHAPLWHSCAEQSRQRQQKAEPWELRLLGASSAAVKGDTARLRHGPSLPRAAVCENQHHAPPAFLHTHQACPKAASPPARLRHSHIKHAPQQLHEVLEEYGGQEDEDDCRWRPGGGGGGVSQPACTGAVYKGGEKGGRKRGAEKGGKKGGQGSPRVGRMGGGKLKGPGGTWWACASHSLCASLVRGMG